MTEPAKATAKLAPSSAFHAEPILWVRHWNDRLFSFAVSRPASFRFRSGEFVMIGLPAEGKPLLRAYSVASPAHADELEFLSIKVQDGPLTSKLQLIQPGDDLWLGRKSTGTLVADALLPGKRLFLLATGTGLAPFLSIIRDPEIYERFEHVVVVHSVRRVSDLAYREELTAKLADDPLVAENAATQFTYIPTVTREEFPNRLRITTMIRDGSLFAHGVPGPTTLSADSDRAMMCGSMDMIKDLSAIFEEKNFVEGSNAQPGHYVIERAFVG